MLPKHTLWQRSVLITNIEALMPLIWSHMHMCPCNGGMPWQAHSRLELSYLRLQKIIESWRRTVNDMADAKMPRDAYGLFLVPETPRFSQLSERAENQFNQIKAAVVGMASEILGVQMEDVALQLIQYMVDVNNYRNLGPSWGPHLLYRESEYHGMPGLSSL